VGIITGILSAIVSALLGVLTGVGDTNVQLVLSQLASLIVSILIQPITFIVVVLLYYDMRIRREAFDIEMLAANL
jgi:ABC-type dipeptide/oligopeptide/nickel transport system permease subunit